MHNIRDIIARIASPAQHLRDTRQVSDGIQVSRRLFRPVAPIQIRADASVPRVPCELADVINVVHDDLQLQPR